MIIDTSCTGCFMMKTIDFKLDLLEIIKRNSEDWDLDEGKDHSAKLTDGSGPSYRFLMM